MAASEFSVDISKWVDKVGDNIDKFMLEFTQDLAEEVVTGTPVDTGFLRGSWTVNIGSPDIQTKGKLKGEKGGGAGINGPAASQESMNRIALNLISVKGGDIVYYTNNVKYGPFVEFGTSRQAAQGFVRNAVAKAETLAANAARRVNK